MFGKAVDLVKEIQQQIAVHGEELEIAFYLDAKSETDTNDSVIGAIQVDGVEHTQTPRLDLRFK